MLLYFFQNSYLKVDLHKKGNELKDKCPKSKEFYTHLQKSLQKMSYFIKLFRFPSILSTTRKFIS